MLGWSRVPALSASNLNRARSAGPAMSPARGCVRVAGGAVPRGPPRRAARTKPAVGAALHGGPAPHHRPATPIRATLRPCAVRLVGGDRLAHEHLALGLQVPLGLGRLPQ